MNTDLNSRVTTAIWIAEQLDELGRCSAPLAWAEVSSLEEELAKAIPASQAEGRIARRGAIRAALKARDLDRAWTLAKRYLAEKNATEAMRLSIGKLLKDFLTPV